MHHVVVGPVERMENDKKVASQSLKNPFFLKLIFSCYPLTFAKIEKILRLRQ